MSWLLLGHPLAQSSGDLWEVHFLLHESGVYGYGSWASLSEGCPGTSCSLLSGGWVSFHDFGESLEAHTLRDAWPGEPVMSLGLSLNSGDHRRPPCVCGIRSIVQAGFASYLVPGSRRRQWQPTPALLPGKSHGRRSLVGCSPRGRWELDTTEQLHFHVLFLCIGEENGNLLQCSCLENPRDGGPWWTTIYGVAQTWTRLKRLSSSSAWIYLWQYIPE